MTEPRRPDPVKPQFLEYRDRSADKSKMSAHEIAGGFLAWVCCVLVAVFAGNAAQSLVVGLVVLTASVACVIVYFFGRMGYRGFIPGMLIGASVTCLLPLGIVAAICWSKSRF